MATPTPWKTIDGIFIYAESRAYPAEIACAQDKEHADLIVRAANAHAALVAALDSMLDVAYGGKFAVTDREAAVVDQARAALALAGAPYPQMGQPISWADHDRISKDGP